MLGIIYLILCFAVGAVFLSLVYPDIFYIMDKAYSGRAFKSPSLLVAFPASYIVGALFMGWPTYILACAFSGTKTPLTYANIVVMLAAFVFIVIGYIILKKQINENIVRCARNFTIVEIVLIVFVFAIAYLLMFLSFYHKENYTGVGVSVYSDFATHIGMIRSFSSGNNFPATYSHYAGSDLKYHFMHQFFVGNLEYLGLRLDLAFNIPSIITFVGAGMLLFALSLKIFGKKSIGTLAVIFFLFRSSSSFFKYVSSIDGTLKQIFETLKNNAEFVGSTTNENWGLYNLNVYANQRHLAFGLCVILISIILMLDNFFNHTKRVTKEVRDRMPENNTSVFSAIPAWFTSTFLTKEGWVYEDLKKPILVGLMLGLSSFWNGACVIGCLLVLFFIAAIADRRFEFVVVAALAVILSVLQSSIFIDGSALAFRWEPGYLAVVKTFFGTLNFINTLLGIFVLLVFASAVVISGYYRWLLFAFVSPIIFALTFQMTTDTSVNHKYIMIGCMLADVFIAGFIYWLFNKNSIFVRVIAFVLIVMMTVTGFYDLTVFIKKDSPANGGSLLFYDDDPTTEWVMKYSDADDIYLTNWYSLNEMVFGGSMLYYGWPYYAWSAGYDTDYRQAKAIEIYTAETKDELIKLTEEEDIRFIVIDISECDTDGNPVVYDGTVINVANIANTYECVYSSGVKNIYDTEKLLGN